VAKGVWSGVGESESWEKVGDDGAVECGEFGRDRFLRRRLSSLVSCECDLDIECEMAYAESEGRRPVFCGCDRWLKR
jgi:hypothetical protein